MDQRELVERVWSHLLGILQREVDASNESQVARRLEVSPSTVTRWLRGERGERVELSHCLRIIRVLGGDMVALARELGYDEVARMLEMDGDTQRVVMDVLKILERGGPAADKLLQEIRFLRWLALGPEGDR